MQVLVDTSIWSLALRRKARHLSPPDALSVNELRELVQEHRIRIIGPVRQELLSGLREPGQYERLRRHLGAFPDEPLATSDYEEAARFGNLCRSAGIAGSASDFLMCAAASARNWTVFTSDQDFLRYARILPVSLHRSRIPERRSN